MFRRLSTPQLAFDLAVAAAALALRTAMGFQNPAAATMALAMAAAFAIRRLSPALALGVAWVGAVVQMAAGLSPDAANLAILAVLYATARYGEPPVRWLGLASAGLGAVVIALYLAVHNATFSSAGSGTPFPPLEGLPWFVTQVLAVGFFALAVLGLSWTLGLLTRTWSNARENRRAQLAAERAFAVEQERNSIARDMHDVVAHSLAVVVAQADGARYADGVDAKDEALATIAGTAREALADVRLLLGQLRHQQHAGPQPVLADLDRLVMQLRDSGLDVVVEREGSPAALPTGQQLAIYRIAQEALTNALRHGDTAREVVLRLDWRRDAAELTVTSALREPVSGAEGHGLPGMRERAILVGGSLDAGPEGGSWVVRARVPFPAGVTA